jgi:hypothetical protein
MRLRNAIVLFSLFFTTSLLAKDVFLSISGKANGFFTDARIFNPSFERDIIVTARYLPTGNNDNSGAAAVQLTIPKRSMKIYDDAVQSIFGGGPALGAIRLTSDDDFVATQRIYQDARSAPQNGTLGQFVPGLDATTALTKGVLIQLKAGLATLGSFRTNWGGANPNSVPANVVLKLYDKNNTVVSTKNITFAPFGVQGPTSIQGYFGTTTEDVTDAWISFTSDQPVFLYGSVVDNGSSDPTFVPASADSGVAPPPPPTKTVTVLAFNGSFEVTIPQGLKVGDQVTFTVKAGEGTHGFRLFDEAANIIVDVATVTGSETVRTVTLTTAGTYTYLCTRPTCSTAHDAMNGTFPVTN